MNPRKHARTSPRGRALRVERILVQGLRIEEAAHAAGVNVRTACIQPHASLGYRPPISRMPPYNVQGLHNQPARAPAAGISDPAWSPACS
jgi:hypothetical protein